MKGSEKQIKWANDIIASAETACNQIVRDAQMFERTGDASICRPVKVAVAEQLKAMVMDGLRSMESASDVINNRSRFGYNALLDMAIQYSK